MRLRYDVLTIKYDAEGNELWNDLFSVEASGDAAHEVAVGLDGSIVIVGTSGYYGSPVRVIVRKYSSEGASIWTRSFFNPLLSNDVGLDVDSDGRSAVGGHRLWAGALVRPLAPDAATSAPTRSMERCCRRGTSTSRPAHSMDSMRSSSLQRGELLWSHTHGLNPITTEQVHALVFTPTGQLVAGGVAGDGQMYLVAFSL